MGGRVHSKEQGSTPRHPNEAELNAIASFVMHPDIDMLSEAELNENLKFRTGYAELLLDFLAYPGHTQLTRRKSSVGRYLALVKANDGSIRRRVELTLDVHAGDHVIRVSESSEARLSVMDADIHTAEMSPEYPGIRCYQSSQWMGDHNPGG